MGKYHIFVVSFMSNLEQSKYHFDICQSKCNITILKKYLNNIQNVYSYRNIY